MTKNNPEAKWCKQDSVGTARNGSAKMDQKKEEGVGQTKPFVDRRRNTTTTWAKNDLPED